MRRLVVLVYALVFTTELCQSSLVPLLPSLERQLSLSGAETGAVLSAATFATLLVALPIGVLSDRVGARRLTIGAGALLAASAAIVGVAGSFAVLEAGRALFGVAFATIWTAGVALVSGLASRRAAVGATIAVGGLAHFVGPVVSGFLAEHVGRAAPFGIAAGIAAAATLALCALPAPAAPAAERWRLRESLHAARAGPELRASLVVMGLLGVVGGAVPLLVPLVLDANGLSAGQIGAVFSGSAGVWILASAAVARLGGRAVRLNAAGFGCAALGLALLLPVATLATAGIAAFLLLRAATQAPVSTISYPLAGLGARHAGIGEGAAIGLANMVWALAAAVTPVAGGALASGLGPRPTFALVGGLVLAAAAWLLVRTRERAVAAEASGARPAGRLTG